MRIIRQIDVITQTHGHNLEVTYALEPLNSWYDFRGVGARLLRTLLGRTVYSMLDLSMFVRFMMQSEKT
jgi:hypothetical protein